MIRDFLILNAPWVVPLTLLLLQFALKLFVAENPSSSRTWETALQAPVEIGFLSLSFTAAVLLSRPDEAEHVFAISVVYIFLLIISIVLWKLAPTQLTVKDMVAASLFSVVNFSMTISMLVYSIGLLAEVGNTSAG